MSTTTVLTPSGIPMLILYLVLSALALVPTTLYWVRYHIKSKGAWKYHHMGRSLFFLAVSLSLTLGFITFNTAWLLIFGESYSLRIPIGMVLFAALGVSLWRQWWSFEKANSDKERGQ